MKGRSKGRHQRRSALHQRRYAALPGFGSSQIGRKAGQAQAGGTAAQTVQMIANVGAGYISQPRQPVGQLHGQPQQRFMAHQRQQLRQAGMIDFAYHRPIRPWQP